MTENRPGNEPVIENLWHREKDGNYVVSSYAPCRVELENGGSFTVESGYPFYDSANIRYHGAAQKITLKLRKPGWCRELIAEIGERRVCCDTDFCEIHETFVEGACVKVRLPMKIRVEDRANLAVGVFRGPLLFSIPMKEKWVRRSGSLPFVDYEVFPEAGERWNYALKLDRDNPEASFHCEEKDLPQQPFQWEQSPVCLKAKAALTSLWRKEQNSAGELPISPVPLEGELREVRLYPYGGCRLRVTELPVLKSEEDQ